MRQTEPRVQDPRCVAHAEEGRVIEAVVEKTYEGEEKVTSIAEDRCFTAKKTVNPIPQQNNTLAIRNLISHAQAARRKQEQVNATGHRASKALARIKLCQPSSSDPTMGAADL